MNGDMLSPQIAGKRPIAVMVENYPDARPQSGLADADIVYETLAEGGITRFLAFYQTRGVPNIGPVRSARTYFADIANEWNAVYAHVGGNSDVLANIRAGDYKNISDADQFFNGDYFHRVSQRPAPHNMYTSTSKLDELAEARGFGMEAAYQPWLFKDDAPMATPTDSIEINFSFPDYAVNYRYDASRNAYVRWMAGKPHTDLDTGKQIIAKTVLVQLVKIYPVQSDTPLSIGMDLASGGKGYVFEDGKVTVGAWKKIGGRTRFYNANGAEISFNRGQIWVELVPDDGVRRISWK